jgi:hypothetical protein
MWTYLILTSCHLGTPHLPAFQFPAINNTNMAAVQTCELGATLSLLPAGNVCGNVCEKTQLLLRKLLCRPDSHIAGYSRQLHCIQ